MGAGRDETADGKDPTAYSVIRAIQMAGGVLGAFDLSGCALLTAAPLNYLEAGAFMWSRLDHTLYATSAEVAASLGLTVQPQRLGEKPSLVPVQVQVANAFAPFAAWLAQTQRILY